MFLWLYVPNSVYICAVLCLGHVERSSDLAQKHCTLEALFRRNFKQHIELKMNDRSQHHSKLISYVKPLSSIRPKPLPGYIRKLYTLWRWEGKLVVKDFIVQLEMLWDISVTQATRMKFLLIFLSTSLQCDANTAL